MEITKEVQNKGQELYQQLVQKAWDSANFKEQLINNPAAAIEEVTGRKTKFTENTEVVVEDQTDTNVIYLNIPRKFEVDDFELSEEELSIVAGGVTPGVIVAIGALAVAAFGAGVALYAASHKHCE